LVAEHVYEAEVNDAKKVGQSGEDKGRTLPQRGGALEGELCTTQHDSGVGERHQERAAGDGKQVGKVLDVEASELINEEGVTMLEEREGNTTTEIRRYHDYTLDISYDTSHLDEVYRLILKRLSR